MLRVATILVSFIVVALIASEGTANDFLKIDSSQTADERITIALDHAYAGLMYDAKAILLATLADNRYSERSTRIRFILGGLCFSDAKSGESDQWECVQYHWGNILKSAPTSKEAEQVRFIFQSLELAINERIGNFGEDVLMLQAVDAVRRLRRRGVFLANQECSE